MAGKIDVESGNPYRDASGHFGTSPDQKLADSFKALQGKKFIPKSGNKGDSNKELIAAKKKEAQQKLAELRGKDSGTDTAPKKLSTIDEAKSYIAGVDKGDFTPEEQEAVKSYISGDYSDINAYMRKGELPALDERSETTKAYSEKRRQQTIDTTERLNAAIDKSSLPEDMDLYRAANLKGKLKVGDSFADDGFVSTSIHTQAPSRMAKNGQIMRIKADKGTPGLFPSSATDVDDDEVEFIIKPSQTFVVTGVTTEDITLDTGKTKSFTIIEVKIK